VRVAFLVPAPDYPTEWSWAYNAEAPALEAAGIEVVPLPWTKTGDLSAFDLILPKLVWGYHMHYPEWLDLLARLERQQFPVANPVPLLRWNGDKSYLEELAAKGIASVPSMTVSELDEAHLDDARAHFGCDELVVKPLISASAHGTFRLGSADPVPEEVRSRRMLVQPWLKAIVDSGEWSLMFFDGVFSHAVAKVPIAGEFRVQPEYGGIVQRCEPPAGSVSLAEAALAAAPAASTYARVDIVVGNEGTLQVIELELIEPALFLAHAPEAGPRFAEAVLSIGARSRE
jgi:glutathione synthase/RimK-type ligase-like ATP-grasp enzyme